MTNRKVIGTITLKGWSVEVSQVEGLTGYRFDAVGAESLPLATELAVMQTQKGQPAIDSILRQGRQPDVG